MTRQSTAPLTGLGLRISARGIHGIVTLVLDGDMDTSPPYQRADIWAEDQQCELLRSVLTETPIPALIINDRAPRGHRADQVGEPTYAVIDGKQRIEALRRWFTGELAIPASWFPADQVATTRPTDDGDYVTYSDLTLVGQRMTKQKTIPVAEGALPTIEAEAEVYLRVNMAGTAQSADDLANAARVAGRDQ